MAAHVIPDVLEFELDVVFCGTAPSATSKERGAYYARPGNRFWPTLFAVGLTPRLLRPEEFRAVSEYGIGLTDVSKTGWGQDADLSSSDFDPDALRSKIVEFAPRWLAFTSKRAAAEALGRPTGYGALTDRIEETRLFVLPSTSGLATRFWDIGPWQDLADRLDKR
ncbi:MAG: mismatch-specific DNA-glycosylase [Thermoleophilaceae bacterium]|nr:mismatch-specific DNA-glycosylase [Thermoleophilaceae bacterium]